MTRFINYRPSRHRLRDGTLGKPERTQTEWQIALAGHVESAHKGKEKLDCAACRELKEKCCNRERV